MRQGATVVDEKLLRRLFTASGPVVSSYFDLLTTPEEDVSLRWRALAERLTEQGADSDAIEMLARKVSSSVPGPGMLAALCRFVAAACD